MLLSEVVSSLGGADCLLGVRLPHPAPVLGTKLCREGSAWQGLGSRQRQRQGWPPPVVGAARFPLWPSWSGAAQHWRISRSRCTAKPEGFPPSCPAGVCLVSVERSLGAWGRSHLAQVQSCDGELGRVPDDGASVPADDMMGRVVGGTLILGSPGPSWPRGFSA